MKRKSFVIGQILLLGSCATALADFPIRQSANHDVLPAVAYNSVNHEYLVVWTELMSYSVMGQRLGEDGAGIGTPFLIYSTGSNPSVAYNCAANEYLVGAYAGGGAAGQRVSNTGTLIGATFMLQILPDPITSSRILYNSISGQYLFLGASLVETPAGSGNFNIKIYSRQIGATGQILGTGILVEDRPHGYYPAEPAFSAAYAPIISPETPTGRYLLAVGRGLVLVMLDSDGAPMNVVYDPAHPGVRYRYVPFSTSSPTGGEFCVDVSYGHKTGYSLSGPAFLVVWADQNNHWQGQDWSGIWGGFVDASKIEYSSTDEVPDNAFPISAIADHYAYDNNVESWRPKTCFNPSSQKFFVVWRETPGTSPYNNTTVVHIRGSYVFEKIPATNVIISSTGGTEDPKYPAVAASTTSEMALVAWQDYRNGASTNWDIYGSIQKVADAVPPTYNLVVTNVFDSGPGSLRQAILDANARSGKDTITFDIPGVGPHTILPATPLPTLTEPVLIDGYTQPGSLENTNPLNLPCNAVLKVVVDGTTLRIAKVESGGLRIAGGNSLVRGLVLNSFLGAGFVLESNGMNVIEGNYIGTDAWGSTGRGNGDDIYIDNVPNNIIGGTTPAARNVVSGNNGVGVEIHHAGATGNIIQGNYLGVNAAGNGVLGHGAAGVYILDAPSNTIGGTTPGAGNVINGFGEHVGGFFARGYGIWMYGDTSSGNVVAGNLIGTNPAGDDTLRNSQDGVWILCGGNTVGGIVSGARNIISGNALEGVYIEGDDNIVQGNYIGTDVSGTKAIGNATGVLVNGGKRNLVGGVSPAAGNVLSGNAYYGVSITSSRTSENRVEGNLIGTQANGVSPLGNTYDGVVVAIWAGHNTVGGAADGTRNVIAFNGRDGVRIAEDSTGNRVSRNSIYANAGLGINLVGGVEDSQGVTINDHNDADTGPNDLQNYPVLTAGVGGDYLDLTGFLGSKPNSTYTLEFFSTPPDNPLSYGEGQTYIGWTTVTTNATGMADFALTIGTPVVRGTLITATATDASGSTSEFCTPLAINVVAGDEVVTNTLDSGPGSLRQAILNANMKAGRDNITFNILGTGPHLIMPATPLPELTESVVIDGYTQPGSSVNTNAFNAGSNAVLKIEIDGTSAGNSAEGLRLSGLGSIVRGLVVNRFQGAGILLLPAGGHRVEGCFIGTDVSGSTQLGNVSGIIVDASYNTIGGLTAEQRNVISGNNVVGIYIAGIDDGHNLVQGNYIGTNAQGTAPLGNKSAGIRINFSGDNTIGGGGEGAGNLISGSGVSSGQQIVGAGVHIGVNAPRNVIKGNLIGTNAAGDAKLENYMDGIFVDYKETVIGGTAPGAGNTISGNALAGIHFGSIGGDLVYGNRIGTDITGTKAVGNQVGILVEQSDSLLIGAFNGGNGNTIAYNEEDGIRVIGTVNRTASRIRIHANSILANGGLGINLVGGIEDSWGQTANDDKDLDTGPNGLQNYPVISSVEGGNSLRMEGYVNSSPNSTFRLDVYATPSDNPLSYQEGQTSLGWTDVTTDAAGNASFTTTIGTPVAAGRWITVTATDTNGNTSEFSAPTIATATGIASEETLPSRTELMQNYPNPFNPKTGIRYQVSGVREAGSGGLGLGASNTKLVVYDLLGREVAVLVNEKKSPGTYEVHFDGSGLASGVYIYRLMAGSFVQSRTMLLVK
jgi:hypothetical protein